MAPKLRRWRLSQDLTNLQPDKVRLSIESRLDQVWLVGLYIRALAEQLGFDLPDRTGLELSVVEALNNAIEHGHRHREHPPIDIVIEVKAGKITIDISNLGDSLTRSLPASINFRPEEDLRDRGRGLQIINQVMDNVDFQHNDGKDHVQMTKYLPEVSRAN